MSATEKTSMGPSPETLRRSPQDDGKKKRRSNPTAGNQGNRCGNWQCMRIVGEMKGHYRIVEDRTILLCDECLKEYDKQEEREMAKEATSGAPLHCGQSDCRRRIEPGEMFYVIDGDSPSAWVLCKDCHGREYLEALGIYENALALQRDVNANVAECLRRLEKYGVFGAEKRTA